MTLLQGCTLPAAQLQLCQACLSLHSTEGASPSAVSQQDSQSSPCTQESLSQQAAIKSQVQRLTNSPRAVQLTSLLTSTQGKKNKGKISQGREREQGLRGDSTTFLCRPQKSINEPCNSISVWRHGRHRGEGLTPCSVADTVHDLSSSVTYTQILLFHPD